MDSNKYEVIVVGAGIAGSAAASALPNKGGEVHLLEQVRLTKNGAS